MTKQKQLFLAHCRFNEPFPYSPSCPPSKTQNQVSANLKPLHSGTKITPHSISTPNILKKEIKEEKHSTLKVTQPLDILRGMPSDKSRKSSRDLPTRDDIQEFSFRLRDDLKVKVQAEVPYQWQERLDEIARQLKVKKLELYRYIIGDFLGEVKPDKDT